MTPWPTSQRKPGAEQLLDGALALAIPFWLAGWLASWLCANG
jgi:hypothetical protein